MTTEMKTVVSEEVVTAITEENKVNNQLNQTNFDFVIVNCDEVDLSSNDEYLYELFTGVIERYLVNNLSGLSLNFFYKGERNTITLYRYGIEPEDVKHDFEVKPSEHSDKLYKLFKDTFVQLKYINDVTNLYISSENSVKNYIKANNDAEAFLIISEYVVNNINEEDIIILHMTKKQ